MDEHVFAVVHDFSSLESYIRSSQFCLISKGIPKQNTHIKDSVCFCFGEVLEERVLFSLFLCFSFFFSFFNWQGDLNPQPQGTFCCSTGSLFLFFSQFVPNQP